TSLYFTVAVGCGGSACAQEEVSLLAQSHNRNRDHCRAILWRASRGHYSPALRGPSAARRGLLANGAGHASTASLCSRSSTCAVVRFWYRFEGGSGDDHHLFPGCIGICRRVAPY